MLCTQAAPKSPHAAPARVCNNDVSLALEPIEEVPEDRFFCSESRHGFDIGEIVDWVVRRRAWNNPYTGGALSPGDVRKLRRFEHPEAAALQVLWDDAQAHVAAAQSALDDGQVGEARRQVALGLGLAPDDAGALALLRALPPPEAPVHAGPIPGHFILRTASPLPDGGASSPEATPPLWDLPGRIRLLPVPFATWRALGDFAGALVGDTSPDLSASMDAIILWRRHADTLSLAARDTLDAKLRIFGAAFSEQFRSATEENYRVNNRRCGVTDLGTQLHAALVRNGLPNVGAL